MWSSGGKLWVGRRSAMYVVFASAILGGVSQTDAQQDDFGLIDGSIVFLDEDSDSRCAAVNTFNADFFIRSCDRRLILTTGDDRETPYLADAGYDVSGPDGSAAGRIRFATDNEGFRQVFWLSDESFAEGPNLVLNYVSDTDELLVATIAGQDGQQVPLEPINVRETQCDPLATFDGGDELLCPRTCGAGAASAGLLMFFMFGVIRFRHGSPLLSVSPLRRAPHHDAGRNQRTTPSASDVSLRDQLMVRRVCSSFSPWLFWASMVILSLFFLGLAVYPMYGNVLPELRTALPLLGLFMVLYTSFALLMTLKHPTLVGDEGQLHCANCGYDLRAICELRCPECGTRVDSTR